MSKYVTVTYDRRTPQVRVQRTINSSVPFPTPPPPVTVYYTIEGTVTDERITGDGFSVPIAFTGYGTIFSASTGSYSLSVYGGYSGVAQPYLSGGSFVPPSRTYTNVQTSYTNHNYEFYGTAEPMPDVIITGEVRIDGTAASNVTISFEGDGQVNTDSFGTYFSTQSYNYTGTSSPFQYFAPGYDVVPPFRTYVSLQTNVAGQDFDIETLTYNIEGVFTSNGTGGAYEITANGTTWFSDAVTGSYGYTVIGGYSGSSNPTWITDPTDYSYVSVVADQLNQDYDVPIPFLTYAYPNLDWSSWAYDLPDSWQIQSQNPDDLTWSLYNTAAGVDTFFEISDFGTYYRILGVDSGVAQITPFSNEVLGEPIDPGTFNVSGQVTTWQGIPMEGIGVEFDFIGTQITDVNGDYIQVVFGGASGTITPHYTGGTFSPQVIVYTNVLADLPDQDFVFYGTVVELSGSVFDSESGEGVPSNLWVDSYGTISTT